ncbi:unnamed protein product [Cochlearia groenlandica]
MGCGSSKNRKHCRKCRGELSPVIIPRSYSMHVHHPPQHSGDAYHTVALTSTTIGSLTSSPLRHFHKHLAVTNQKRLFSDQSCNKKLVSVNGFEENHNLKVRDPLNLKDKLLEAKIWSSMMNEKIPKIVPKTPIFTPPGEPETINTWELMEGLEDVISPLPTPNHVKSFSFDVVRIKPCNDNDDDCENVKSNGAKDQRFGSLQEEEERCKRKLDKVIFYFTSLRGIRKTYEDSCNVRIILKSLRIRVDERDVSMHSGFKDELKKLLRDEFKDGVGITLPRVFLGDKYLGGVDEIKRLNENGTLEKLVESCEKIEEDGLKGCVDECEACGDVRFVPCETCSGSCKIYYEEEEEEEETEFGFKRCLDCNENGLIRCPVCCQ